LLALGLFGIAVAAPLVEEFAKSLAIPLLALAGHRPGRLAGFALGVAAGAGFAALEGITTGSLALMGGGSWALLMLVRGAAATMHCLASGLAGLGWQALITEGRWLRGLGLGLSAIALHGAWNAAAGVQTLQSLSVIAGQGSPGPLAGLGLVLPVGFLAALWLGVLIALMALPRHLRRQT
jgi:RsiW-degrading membrane proteinase PrsW (M82 family)